MFDSFMAGIKDIWFFHKSHSYALLFTLVTLLSDMKPSILIRVWVVSDLPYMGFSDFFFLDMIFVKCHVNIIMKLK